MDDWDSLITEAEAERFVGRKQELDLFQREITLSTSRCFIFYITGQGGSGKTTLLRHYQNIARDNHFLVAECDEQQKDVPAILGHFAQQLAESHIKLENFEKRYKVYQQHRDEIENDPEAPQGIAAFLGKTLVRATYMVGDTVPGIRKGLEYLPQDALESQASDWATYLAKKLSNKDDRALMRDPVSNLAPLFFKDLNLLASKRPVLLCFENFEVARPEVQTWLCRLREYKPSRNIRLAIAARNPLAARWDPLRAATKVISIDVFTAEEAELFLDTHEIIDQQRRAEILQWSGRLPVLMSWLAAPQGDAPDPSIPTHDVVERFLRWVTDSAQRQIALLAAFPRTFNLDILRELLGHETSLEDVQTAFNWLQSMPFVQLRLEGWQYHAVVRRMMLQYQRQSSPQGYADMHMLLAKWYQAQRQKKQVEGHNIWMNEQWCKETLSYLYHALAADSSEHWSEVIDTFVIALRKHQEFAREIIELLRAEDLYDELLPDQRETVALFHEQFQEIIALRAQNALAMFEYICHMQNLSPQAKLYAFAYRGQSYYLNMQGPQALADFEMALSFDHTSVRVLAQRGLAYSRMGRYEEALQDLDRAIELASKDGLVYNIRGNIYQEMKRYEEALADFNQAIKLDANNAWAFAGRGATHQGMKKYTEALADFSQAIALDANNQTFVVGRGFIYQEMGKYAEALADFSRAIELDSNDAWAFSLRGNIYQRMERDAEALADYSRFIELNANSAATFAVRGSIYQRMKRYAEALADFNRAIDLDTRNTRTLIQRGITYFLQGKYVETLADFQRVIELDSNNSQVFFFRGESYRLLGKYAEALTDFNRAIEIDANNVQAIAQRGITYRLMGKMTEALDDFNRAIEIDANNAQMIALRGIIYRLMGRTAEALDDFNRAIEIDANNGAYRYCRAQIAYLLHQESAFERDIDTAIKLVKSARASSSNVLNNWQLDLDLALCHLFRMDYTEAHRLWDQLLATYTSAPILRSGVDALNDLLTVQPQNELIPVIQQQLHKRIIELEQSGV